MVALTPQQEKLISASPLSLYKELSVGRDGSFLELFIYELVILFSNSLPGILGLGARYLLYPLVLKKCGKKTAFGRNVTIRQPNSISIGSNVLIDDYAVLDVRNYGAINIADKVSIGRFSTITAKKGSISLEPGVNIGTYCRIATQSQVVIGESTLIAAYCYIGPGNHQHNSSKPMISSEMEIKGGVNIGKHCWIGTRATIMDGVTIGDGSIVGAHSLVLKDVPPGVVVAGTPAKIIKAISSENS